MVELEIEHRPSRSNGAACFSITGTLPEVRVEPRLRDAHAEALSMLLPILGCGEEAAVLGFERIARSDAIDCHARDALAAIARDERRHDALLRGLKSGLPDPEPDPGLQTRARRFHLSLSRGGPVLNLARIAGLDTAVCTILSQLLTMDRPCSRDGAVRSTLAAIRTDEVRHVAITRDLVAASTTNAQAHRDAAAEARSNLAELLKARSHCFDVLCVDPDRLLCAVRRLPDGLFGR